MSQPKQDVLKVIAGAALDETYYVWDDVSRSAANWTATGTTWQVEMEIRDRRGRLLARIANFGVRDGEVTLLSEGRLRIHLPGSVTANMPHTRTYTNSTDPRVATWRSRGRHAFDLIATETVSGDVSDLVQGSLVVNQPVSA